MKANLKKKKKKTANREVTGLPTKAAQPRSLETALRGTGAGAFVNHDFLFISCGLTLRHPRRLASGLGLQTGFPPSCALSSQSPGSRLSNKGAYHLPSCGSSCTPVTSR